MARRAKVADCDGCDNGRALGWDQRCPQCGRYVPGCGTSYLVPLWPRGPSWVELRERHAELWAEIAAGIAGHNRKG